MSDRKRQREGDDDDRGAKLFKSDPTLYKKLKSCAESIKGIDRQCAAEQIQVQQKHDRLKQKHYAERSKMILEIPQFWKIVLLKFFEPVEFILEEEKPIFEYLKDINLQDNIDMQGSHKYTLTWKENPYFEELKWTRDVKIEETDDKHKSEPGWSEMDEMALHLKITSSPITWKKKICDDFGSDENAQRSFIHWWTCKDDPDESNSVAQLLRETVWDEAITIYLQPTAQEESDAE